MHAQQQKSLIELYQQHDEPRLIEQSYEQVCYYAFNQASEYSLCLPPLLRALHWPGRAHHLAEVLPHFTETLNFKDFKAVMRLLHYQSKKVPVKLSELDTRLAPCLFIPKQGPAMVILEADENTISIYNSEQQKVTLYSHQELCASEQKGTLYLFQPFEKTEETTQQSKQNWLADFIRQYYGLAGQVVGLSLVLNLLYLATPFFIKAIYDYLIPTGSLATLVSFCIGIVIAFAGIAVLQHFRSFILLHVSAAIDTAIGNKIFETLLYIPAGYTENASIGSQVGRIKDFESARELLMGPVITLLFELPFVLLFIGVIGLLGGPLMLIPLTMVVIALIISLAFLPVIKRITRKAAKANSQRQEFLIEALKNLRALKISAFEKVWQNRFSHLSARAALTSFHTIILSSVINVISDVLMIISGIAIIAFGVSKILAGTISMGALIAIMMLVWRILSPIKLAFATLIRFTQVYASAQQLKLFLQLPSESNPRKLASPLKIKKARVDFNRVTLRYSAKSNPAVLGASFYANPGEIIAITGPNGSGKTTLFKLLLGLYQPQTGSISINGMDIRQLDPLELRKSIAYVPQEPQLFYGTVAQNLRLVKPHASQAELEEAVNQAGLLEDILALPFGFATRLRDQTVSQLPSSFQQRLSLARAYLKKSSILLLDEPSNTLDEEGDQKFLQTVQALRTTATIIIISHRPSHLRIADHILVFNEGNLVCQGEPGKILETLPKELL